MVSTEKGAENVVCNSCGNELAVLSKTNDAGVFYTEPCATCAKAADKDNKQALKAAAEAASENADAPASATETEKGS